MKERLSRKAFVVLILLLQIADNLVNACIGGGGGGAACCPPAARTCAPAMPVCSSSSYSSYSSGGGSYAAPQASYPRPIGYSTGGGCGSTGCGSSAGSSYASAPSSYASVGGGYAPPPVSSYQSSFHAPLAVAPPQPSYSVLPHAPPPPPPSYQSNLAGPPPPPPPPQPIQPSYTPEAGAQPEPAAAIGTEIESAYEDINQDHQPEPVTLQPAELASQPIPVSSVTNTFIADGPPPEPPVAQLPYGGESEQTENAVQSVPASVSVPPANNANVLAAQSDYTDDTKDSNTANAALNCDDTELRHIVETALQSSSDNLEVARKIESEAAARFGGRFNSIVSNSEFAYVNWYGKRNCQLRINDRHSLTWED